MHKKQRKALKLSAVFFVLFILFTVLVQVVDVQPIGPNGSKVGFATFNASFMKKIPYDPVWEKVTDILGYIAILFGGCFALTGLYQWITRKGLQYVDRTILCLGGLFVLLGIVYVIFEIFIVNYRPVLIDGKLEASYPSSHTILSCVIMGASIYEMKCLRRPDNTRRLLTVFCIIMIVVIVLGRLVSGVHWVTDIIAAVLLSASMIFLYHAAVCTVRILEHDAHQKRMQV